MADLTELLPRLQACLDSAKASEANPTSQRALEYRLAEAIAALSRRSATAEPVAWHTVDIRGHIAEVSWLTADRDAWIEQGYTVRPLYAEPPASPISDEMVERAAIRSYEYEGDKRGIRYAGWEFEPESVKAEWRDSVRVALVAALGGQHD